MAPGRTTAKKRDRRKLAAYLGAGTAHRFRRKGKITVGQAHWRTRMFVLAVLLSLVSAWGLWREFF